MLKTEHNKRYYSRNMKKKNTSLYYLILGIILLSVPALYFSRLSIKNFLLIFILEILGLVFLIAMILFCLRGINKRKKNPRRSEKSSINEKRDLNSYPIMHRDRKQRKLIKLDKIKFNWSDEEVTRNTRDKKTIKEKQDKTFTYRSPFDPINPIEKEETRIGDEVINDEK